MTLTYILIRRSFVLNVSSRRTETSPTITLPLFLVLVEGKATRCSLCSGSKRGTHVVPPDRWPALRICPGRYLAEDGMWLVVASMLAVFDVVKAKDKNGDEIEVDPEFIDNAVQSVGLAR